MSKNPHETKMFLTPRIEENNNGDNSAGGEAVDPGTAGGDAMRGQRGGGTVTHLNRLGGGAGGAPAIGSYGAVSPVNNMDLQQQLGSAMSNPLFFNQLMYSLQQYNVNSTQGMRQGDFLYLQQPQLQTQYIPVEQMTSTSSMAPAAESSWMQDASAPAFSLEILSESSRSWSEQKAQSIADKDDVAAVKNKEDVAKVDNKEDPANAEKIDPATGEETPGMSKNEHQNSKNRKMTGDPIRRGKGEEGEESKQLDEENLKQVDEEVSAVRSMPSLGSSSFEGGKDLETGDGQKPGAFKCGDGGVGGCGGEEEVGGPGTTAASQSTKRDSSSSGSSSDSSSEDSDDKFRRTMKDVERKYAKKRKVEESRMPPVIPVKKQVLSKVAGKEKIIPISDESETDDEKKDPEQKEDGNKAIEKDVELSDGELDDQEGEADKKGGGELDDKKGEADKKDGGVMDDDVKIVEEDAVEEIDAEAIMPALTIPLKPSHVIIRVRGLEATKRFV